MSEPLGSFCGCAMPQGHRGAPHGWHLDERGCAYERCPSYWRKAGYEVYRLTPGQVAERGWPQRWANHKIGLRLIGSSERLV